MYELPTIQLVTPYQLGLLSRATSDLVLLSATTKAINYLLVVEVNNFKEMPEPPAGGFRISLSAQRIFNELVKLKESGMAPDVDLSGFSPAIPFFNGISFDIRAQYDSVGWSTDYFFLKDNQFLERFEFYIPVRAKA